jgi:putative peptidoglycan lipid II flippase
MLAALTGLIIAVVGALLLFPLYGHVGIAAAIAISGWLAAGVLAALLLRNGRLGLNPEGWRRLRLIALAAVLMGLAIGLAQHGLVAKLHLTGSTLGSIATLGALVAGGLVTYLALLQAFGVIRLRDLVAMRI